MGAARPPDDVQPFVAVLSADPAVLSTARGGVEALLGPVDAESAAWPFEATDYYTAEMGASLERRFWSFERTASPGELAAWKSATNAIEARLGRDGRRTVNLDPGYVSLSHVALASTKPHSHRLFLRDGIYGEVTLLWHKSGFETLPWTFPEYRTAPVQDFLARVRERFHERLHPRNSSSARDRRY